jgi:hypothetical protein
VHSVFGTDYQGETIGHRLVTLKPKLHNIVKFIALKKKEWEETSLVAVE